LYIAYIAYILFIYYILQKLRFIPEKLTMASKTLIITD